MRLVYNNYSRRLQVKDNAPPQYAGMSEAELNDKLPFEGLGNDDLCLV